MMLGEVILTLGKRREVVHDLKLPMQAGSHAGEVHRGEQRRSLDAILDLWHPLNVCSLEAWEFL